MGSVEADALAVTANGAAPEVGFNDKAAAGAPTVAVRIVDAELPAVSVTVTFTVYRPPDE